MSLFRSPIRPHAILSDEAVERYVSAIRAGLDPDPLFRRRLRGHVVNRFVESREGHATGRPLKREMTRIGRAVLSASFALSVSVSGVLGASQHALPGEVLYSLKRQVEGFRVHVLPDHLHATVAAHELRQRISELERLIDTEQWGRVAAHAGAVEQAYAVAIELSGPEGLGAADLLVIHGLLDQLPESTRSAVEDLMVGLPASDAGLSGSDSGASGTEPSGSGTTEPSGSDGSEATGDEQPASPDQGSGSGGGRTDNDGANPNDTTNQGRNQEDNASNATIPERGSSGERSPKPSTEDGS